MHHHDIFLYHLLLFCIPPVQALRRYLHCSALRLGVGAEAIHHHIPRQLPLDPLWLRVCFLEICSAMPSCYCGDFAVWLVLLSHTGTRWDDSPSIAVLCLSTLSHHLAQLHTALLLLLFGPLLLRPFLFMPLTQFGDRVSILGMFRYTTGTKYVDIARKTRITPC